MGTGNTGITQIEIGYTINGNIAWREDGNGNRTTYIYDPYDRPERTTFPDNSYEELAYNARSLVHTFRRRGGQIITYAYDNANRRTSASYSNSDPTVTYSYDGLGRETQIVRTGVSTISYDYDGLGRRDEATQDGRTLSYSYDIAGRRTRLLYPDNFDIRYDWSPAAQLTAIREQGGPTLIDYDYDGLGRMTQVTRSNGRVTDYTYGPLSRLSELEHVGMLTNSFTYNPGSQLSTRSVSASPYRWNLAVDLSQSYSRNNLNQYTSISGAGLSYDTNGNLTGDPGAVTGSNGSSTFTYDAENRLTGASGTVSGTLTYDGLGRMLSSAGGGETAVRYLYDGDELVAEYNSAGTAILHRYVHGAGVDDPMVWYEGAGTANRRFLHSDERGSIIAISNNTGGVTNINTYDTWGVPNPDNIGRFQYTGQAWLRQLNLYQYKARMYAPHIGRFMQTDPIGYEDGMNMYTYVGNDPVNGVDPTGLCSSVDDAEKRADCFAQREAQVEAATTYLEGQSVRVGSDEAAYIATYDEDTGEVTVRTGDEAGVRSGGDVQFLDNDGNRLRASPEEDGRIYQQDGDNQVRTSEVVLATGHSHPRENPSDPGGRALNRANENIRRNPGDQVLSTIAPAVIKTPSGRIRVFVNQRPVR